jgi:DNA-binding NarL/FixJ family response regulator
VTLRVFLAEDMKPVRERLAELLSQAGDCRVAGAAGTEAECKLWLDEHAGRWDLAVIDLVLAQGTGLGVLARARQTHPAGRAVVFSDYVSPGIRQHCLELGAAAVFHKADQAPDFVAFCRELVRGATDEAPSL